MADLYPLFMNLAGHRAVVIGGGTVALRKIEALWTAGAQIKVVSPEISEQIRNLISEARLEWLPRKYEPGDLAGAMVAIVACGNQEVNRRAWAEAREKRILINVVDEPDFCTFHVPAVVRRGPVQIAISTGGQSPALAKYLRRKLEAAVGPEYGQLAAELGKFRDWLRENVPDQARRAQILEKLVNSHALELLRKGKKAEFLQMIEEIKLEVKLEDRRT